MLLHPKPAKPIRGTKSARDHMALVAQLPCCICRRFAVECHHVIHDRHAQRKSSDFDTIPLCKPCHDELHASPDLWRRRYGADHGFLALVKEQIADLQRRTIS